MNREISESLSEQGSLGEFLKGVGPNGAATLKGWFIEGIAQHARDSDLFALWHDGKTKVS